VPYQMLLDQLMERVDGARAAVLLDEEGERVVEAGARDYRHRLIGAYQGIALLAAHRVLDEAAGAIDYILCRYDWGTIVLRPMRDGYYLILSLSPDVIVGPGLHRSVETQLRIDENL